MRPTYETDTRNRPTYDLPSRRPTFLRRGLAAAVMVLSAMACSGAGDGSVALPDGFPAAGVIRLSDQFQSTFTLIDQEGNAISGEDLKGKVAIIYFGFATCPDVCPLALGRLSAGLSLLSEKERGEIEAVFITVDPERDTPQALGEFLKFDPSLRGLTGAQDAIDAAKQSFKVYSAKRPLPDSEASYTVDHTSLFYVVDREGAPRVALNDSLTPEEIADYLRHAASWK